ncbi:hypothetical protein TWF106_008050, partial [Orbilia oligospora]
MCCQRVCQRNISNYFPLRPPFSSHSLFSSLPFLFPDFFSSPQNLKREFQGVGLGQESRARSIANIQTSRQPPIPATLVSRSLSHQTSSSGPWPWEDDDDPVGVNDLVPSVPSSASSQPLASLSSSSTSTVDDDDDDNADNGDRR